MFIIYYLCTSTTENLFSEAENDIAATVLCHLCIVITKQVISYAYATAIVVDMKRREGKKETVKCNLRGAFTNSDSGRKGGKWKNAA